MPAHARIARGYSRNVVDFLGFLAALAVLGVILAAVVIGIMEVIIVIQVACHVLAYYFAPVPYGNAYNYTSLTYI